MRNLLLSLLSVVVPLSAAADSPALASKSINEFGVDLYRKLATEDSNLCLSPFSIQYALAMTYAGAAGDTEAEMRRTLHYPGTDSALHESFSELSASLDRSAKKSEEILKRQKLSGGGGGDPTQIRVANRLYGRSGYAFRESYLALVKKFYSAPLEAMDTTDPEKSRGQINAWVEQQTASRIRDFLPRGVINAATRLILVNAMYFKSAWADEFETEATAPKPFFLTSGKAEVPTMFRRGDFPYHKAPGYQAVMIPYSLGEFYFLALVPDETDGLAALEKELSPSMLSDLGFASRDLNLFLPKFKIEPPAVRLSQTLRELGMSTAFDSPPKSANFDGIAARTPGDYLYISEVIHKTYISLDESGTEAAAATAVITAEGAAFDPNPPQPIDLRIDRPFIYAVIHRSSKAVLFLGKVVDPR